MGISCLTYCCRLQHDLRIVSLSLFSMRVFREYPGSPPSNESVLLYSPKMQQNTPKVNGNSPKLSKPSEIYVDNDSKC